MIKINIVKNIILISFFIISITETYASQNYWEKILHIKNNSTNIVSENFYISEINSITSERELLLTIDYLNSKNGNEFACNFPLRYLYIKENYKVKNYSLSNCKDLNNFISNYIKNKISIVFASEYTNNPSSAFGHAMLLMHNDKDDIEIGDVIHFFAHTDNDKFLKYALKGFSGKYDSYYGIDKFYKKRYEYNTLEQRYIYVYTLNFTEEDLKKIIYHLYELRKAKFKYYFGTINCAQKIIDLLSVAKNPELKKYNFFSLPIDVIGSYKKYIKDKYIYYPHLYKINALTENFNKEDKKKFLAILSGEDSELSGISNDFKLALINATTFNFRHSRIVNKNYSEIMNLSVDNYNYNDNTINPVKKIYPKNFTVAFSDNKIIFNYNTVGKYFNDLSSDFKIQDTEVRALNFSLTSLKNIKVDSIDFLSVKSFPSQTFYYKPISWIFYSGFNRNNEAERLKFNNEFGKGFTLSYKNFFKSSMVLSIGNESSDLYIKPNIFFYNQYKNLKYGVNFSKKFFGGKKDYYAYKYYISLFLNNRHFVTTYEDDKFTFRVRSSF